MLKDKIPVAVLGATGSVGQRFISLLDQHPWFRVAALTASERSAGKPYRQACHWILPEAMPTWAEEMLLLPSAPEHLPQARIVFSALPADEARIIEPLFAGAGIAVCSNASAFRREADVPLLLPEVNADHIRLVEQQRVNHGWKGCIVTNPNCTSTGLTVALKALDDRFGVTRVMAVSLQALSGAGYPGVPSLDVIDNVIPYIAGEEEKLEWEPRKMLGKLTGSQVSLAPLLLSAHTNRVPVTDGHLVCASVELSSPADTEQALEAFHSYQCRPLASDLPSTPRPVIAVSSQPDRPQPRLDRLAGSGMTTVVGRVRTDPLFHLKFVVCSHNTIRGAAGGSIYNAELLVKEGLV
ncbi:MAG TPA: aspartate-semialdehyde dehydrogenase [Anaerolineaceae bacterium]|nr:aspartate-semialdehyde dehydrogenase [Anaerolineaceae bacterium]